MLSWKRSEGTREKGKKEIDGVVLSVASKIQAGRAIENFPAKN